MNLDKAKGAFFGLAIGDALGVPLEFKARDSVPPITGMIEPGQLITTLRGPFKLAPGEWTDDTSMALALTDALISHGVNPEQMLANFAGWMKNGEYSHNHRCFDIGITTRKSIQEYITSGKLEANGHILNSGNGGIMRLAPVAIFAKTQDDAASFGRIQSKTTHASKECLDYAELLSRMLWLLMNDNKDPVIWGLDNDILYEDLGRVAELPREQINSSGYVKSTMEAACWAIYNGKSFEESLLLAVNLADDADTVGAVTGQIAGAKYGYDSIPKEWLDLLKWKDKLEDYFDRLVKARG